MLIRFSLNGRPVTVDASPDRRVVDLLREEFGLTGTKEGCGSGECGACTILLNGENRLSCLMVAAQLEGKKVVTIEGMAEGPSLHPLQEAFVEKGAIQCGFCTPGMVLAAAALLAKNPIPSRLEIREGMSGNLCRCTGYQKIVDAVEAAAAHLGAAAKGAPGEEAAMGDIEERPCPPAVAGQGERDKPLPAETVYEERPCPSGRVASLRPVGGTPRRIYLPGSLDELWSCLDREPQAALFSGGTDLFVLLRAGKRSARALIGLERIADLQGIREEAEGLWIGAATTHGRLLAETRFRECFPVLAQALGQLGSPPIRHMGTIGGNVCTASPAGDSLPPLYCLEAEVELLSAGGRRCLPVSAFITGPGKTQLRPGEILAGIRVKDPADFTVHHFEKVGQRQALACGIASLAALVKLSPEGEIEALRLAWGSVGATVITAAQVPGLREMLIGRKLSPALWEEAGALVSRAVSPIDDLRATAAYRRQVAGNLLLRLGASLAPTAK